jgi:hypothetical protein
MVGTFSLDVNFGTGYYCSCFQKWRWACWGWECLVHAGFSQKHQAFRYCLFGMAAAVAELENWIDTC